MNLIRISHYNLLNKRIKIDYKSKIGQHCKIFCDNKSNLVLKNIVLDNGVTIQAKRGGKIFIEDAFIGNNSVIVSINEIIIMPKTEIAEMVVIRDQNHKHNLSDEYIKKQGYDSKPILIKENVWIGAKATILKGVVIEKNSVIGAHSLVLTNIDEGSVYVGTPAKKIKK